MRRRAPDGAFRGLLACKCTALLFDGHHLDASLTLFASLTDIWQGLRAETSGHPIGSGRLFADNFCEVCAAVFEQSEDVLKAVVTIVIRIRNAVLPRGHLDKSNHRHYLVLCFDCRRHVLQFGHVVCVHADEYVEVVEIDIAHLPAYMVKSVSAPLRVYAHAVVREVAHVPSAGAGAVYDPGIRIAVFVYTSL